MQQEEPNKYVKELTQEKYKYGFTTDVHTDIIERGLNEDVVRLISEKKGEPEWLLEFRLKAYRHWLTLEMPTWAHLRIPEIDYQAQQRGQLLHKTFHEADDCAQAESSQYDDIYNCHKINVPM